MTTCRATNVDGAKNFIRDTQPACRWTQLAIACVTLDPARD